MEEALPSFVLKGASAYNNVVWLLKIVSVNVYGVQLHDHVSKYFENHLLVTILNIL
jgi:hypothetical protein